MRVRVALRLPAAEMAPTMRAVGAEGPPAPEGGVVAVLPEGLVEARVEAAGRDALERVRASLDAWLAAARGGGRGGDQGL